MGDHRVVQEKVIWKYCVMDSPTDEFILPDDSVVLGVTIMAHGGTRIFYIVPKENYFHA